jgi:general secretion pathway protein G
MRGYMPIYNRKTFPFGCYKKTLRVRGFTQVELIVVIAVIAVITSIGIGVYSHFIDTAKNTRAIAEIRVLEKEILDFWHSNDRLPDTLGELDRSLMLDPWKTPYQYINFDTASDLEEKRRTKGNKGKGKGKGDPLNSDYDLFSKGKDRTSAPVLTDNTSKDDIIRADDGSYTGLVSEYKS